MSSREKSYDFKDLHVWQEGHKAVLAIYKVTSSFPNTEQFTLTSQLRKAAVSITSNIAEGFARRTIADKTHFYTMSLGSISECRNQLKIARDLGYASTNDSDNLEEMLVTTRKLLNALIRSMKTSPTTRYSLLTTGDNK